MAHELVYTSAERGLRSGTSGFCTVAMTRGLPPALVPRLEALGGYRPGPLGDGPRAHCFWRVETAGSVANVLAVVGPAPPDHTQRTNKIASYLVLGPDELAPAGPAWLLAQRGLLRDGWSGTPAWIEAPTRVPGPGPSGPRRCAAWEAATGDAGWAGVVASAFLRDQSKPIHVVWREGVDPLALVGDVLSLMPDWARWRATFSTYFLQPVAGTPCALRFCLSGTPAADAARHSKGLVCDLTRPLGAAADGRFSRMARSGFDEESDARDDAPSRRRPSRRASARGTGAEPPMTGEESDEILLEPAEELPPEPDGGARARPTMPLAPRASEGPARVDALRRRITITAISGALLILALGVLFYVVSAYRSMIDASVADVVGPRVPSAQPGVERQAPEPADREVQARPGGPAESEGPVVPDVPAQRESPPSVTPSAEQGPGPSVDTTVSPDSVRSGLGVSPAAPPEGPQARALPAGLIGARWSLRRDATRGGAKAELRWSSEIGTSRGKQARFRIPEGLSGRGLRAEGNVLTVAGSGFRVRAAVDGPRLAAFVESRGAMPAALAEALGQEAGQDSNEAWSALMGIVTIDVSDAAGASLGQAQCRVDRRRTELAAGGDDVRVPVAPVLALVAQVVSDPGAPSQRRIVTQCFVDPGAEASLDPSVLLRLRLDRRTAPGVLSMRARTLDAADRAERSARITQEHASVEALLRQIDPLRRPVTGIDPDSEQVSALDAAWAALPADARALISPDAPQAAPRTAAAMKASFDALQPGLRARKDALLRELGELRPRDGKLPPMFLRVSTPEGAIVFEQSLSLGGRP